MLTHIKKLVPAPPCDPDTPQGSSCFNPLLKGLSSKFTRLHVYYKVGCKWTYTHTDRFHGNTRSPAVVATGAPNASEGHCYLLHQATKLKFLARTGLL